MNSLNSLVLTDLPKLDLVLDLSMIACLLGLFNTERLAREMSAVTLVMDILLEKREKPKVLNLIKQKSRLELKGWLIYTNIHEGLGRWFSS